MMESALKLAEDEHVQEEIAMPTVFELERGARMQMVLPREGRVMQVMEKR